MHAQTSRRQFLCRVAGAGFTLAAAGPLPSRTARAIQPFSRTGTPRMYLGLAAYSLRSYFKDSNHKRDQDTSPSDRIDMFQFVDYCADLGCDGAELTSYYFPADLTDDYLVRLKRHAF